MTNNTATTAAAARNWHKPCNIRTPEDGIACRARGNHIPDTPAPAVVAALFPLDLDGRTDGRASGRATRFSWILPPRLAPCPEGWRTRYDWSSCFPRARRLRSTADFFAPSRVFGAPHDGARRFTTRDDRCKTCRLLVPLISIRVTGTARWPDNFPGVSRGARDPTGRSPEYCYRVDGLNFVFHERHNH